MAKILNCSQEEYFRDPCPTPSLTQSIAKTLLDKSPAHAWLEHPRFGNQRRASTADQNEGTLIHTLLLGTGTEIEIIHADNFRTKVAQELRDAAIAAGKLPVLEGKYDAALQAADCLRENIASFGITLSGASELALCWEEEGERGPVICRCRMDHVFLNDGIILDVKKCESAHPSACSRSAVSYGYDIQHAAYTRAVAQLHPRPPVKMLFLFCEMEAPYAVVPAEPDGALRELGEIRWQRAVKLWERCLADNDWPSYTREPVQLIAPMWALAQEGLWSEPT